LLLYFVVNKFICKAQPDLSRPAIQSVAAISTKVDVLFDEPLGRKSFIHLRVENVFY